MKKLYGTMLVIGLLILSSGIALGAISPQNMSNNTNATVTETPTRTTSQPTDTTVEPTTAEPTITETTVVPLPKATPKSPGFEIVLTIGVLSAIYIVGKFGKRR